MFCDVSFWMKRREDRRLSITVLMSKYGWPEEIPFRSTALSYELIVQKVQGVLSQV